VEDWGQRLRHGAESGRKLVENFDPRRHQPDVAKCDEARDLLRGEGVAQDWEVERLKLRQGLSIGPEFDLDHNDLLGAFKEQVGLAPARAGTI